MGKEKHQKCCPHPLPCKSPQCVPSSPVLPLYPEPPRYSHSLAGDLWSAGEAGRVWKAQHSMGPCRGPESWAVAWCCHRPASRPSLNSWLPLPDLPLSPRGQAHQLDRLRPCIQAFAWLVAHPFLPAKVSLLWEAILARTRLPVCLCGGQLSVGACDPTAPSSSCTPGTRPSTGHSLTPPTPLSLKIVVWWLGQTWTLSLTPELDLNCKVAVMGHMQAAGGLCKTRQGTVLLLGGSQM